MTIDYLLRDVLSGGTNSANSKENIITEEVTCKHLNLFWERGRKHHSLSPILRSRHVVLHNIPYIHNHICWWWTGTNAQSSTSRALTWLRFKCIFNIHTFTCSTILRIWGSKPMSSIRSASSRQRYLQHSRLILPRSRKSTSLPGVATSRWQPLSSSRI